MGVRRRVASVSEIGLDLDQPNHQPFPGLEASNQPAADEFGRDDSWVACIEGLAKRSLEGHRREYRKNDGSRTPFVVESASGG